MNEIHALRNLFKPQEGPDITGVEVKDGAAVITLQVGEHLSWFDGHFPEQKVLPGVVQVDWAGKLAKALFVSESRFQQLTNIKFKTMVMPGAAMRLTLTHNAAKESVAFKFSNDTDAFSTGSFKFSTS